MKKDHQESQSQSPPTQSNGSNSSEFKPANDIIEFPDKITLYADMPGVTAQSLEVSVDKNVLTLKGEVSNVDIQGFEPVYSEYRIGRYSRSYTLGSDLDPQGIRAEIHSGVVTLTLPKAAKAKPRRIEVEVA